MISYPNLLKLLLKQKWIRNFSNEQRIYLATIVNAYCLCWLKLLHPKTRTDS